MVLLPIVVAIAIGLFAGALRRGRIASLAQTRLRHPWLLAVALACSVAVDFVDPPAPMFWAVLGLIAGLVFAGTNLLVVGMAVIGVGIALNLIPVMVNGSMPVRGDALVDAEIVAAEDLDRVELRGARELADQTTSLEILGDVIPVPSLGQVMSFGDLIVLVGLADVVHNLMRQRRPRRFPRGTDATLAALGWLSPAGFQLDGLGANEGTAEIDLREPIPQTRLPARARQQERAAERSEPAGSPLSMRARVRPT